MKTKGLTSPGRGPTLAVASGQAGRQKNHGYELQHAYCSHPWAARNFYYLLPWPGRQVAHAIHQLMIQGSLLRPFDQLLGSLRNFLCQLAQSFAKCVIPSALRDTRSPPAIQIRLDSS